MKQRARTSWQVATWVALMAPLALALAAGPALAEEAQPVTALEAAPSPLDLASAVLLAKQQALGTQAARAQLQVTEAERAVTISNVLPTVSLSSTGQYQRLPGASASAFGGGGFGNIVGFPASGATVDSTLSASQTLFDAFATRDTLGILELNLANGRLAVAAAEQEAMGNAALAYFDVLRAEGLAEVAAEGLRNAQSHLRLSELRERAGTGTRSESLQVRAQVADASGKLTQARHQVALARLSLANLLNQPVMDRPLAARPSVPTLRLGELNGELAKALLRRVDVQQATLSQRAAEAQVSLESRALLPTLQAQSSYAQRNLAEGQFSASVRANWTLFDSFRVRNRMESASHRAKAAQVQLEQARQRAALDVRQQVQGRIEASQRVTSSREGLSAAQEAYRLGLKRYEVGLGTTFELTDLRLTLSNAGTNHVTALNDLRAAEVRVARALGVDLGAYLAGGATGP